jgi:hypothetical protein
MAEIGRFRSCCPGVGASAGDFTAFGGLDGIHHLFHGAAMNGLFSICGISREIMS